MFHTFPSQHVTYVWQIVGVLRAGMRTLWGVGERQSWLTFDHHEHFISLGDVPSPCHVGSQRLAALELAPQPVTTVTDNFQVYYGNDWKSANQTSNWGLLSVHDCHRLTVMTLCLGSAWLCGRVLLTPALATCCLSVTTPTHGKSTMTYMNPRCQNSRRL